MSDKIKLSELRAIRRLIAPAAWTITFGEAVSDAELAFKQTMEALFATHEAADALIDAIHAAKEWARLEDDATVDDRVNDEVKQRLLGLLARFES